MGVVDIAAVINADIGDTDGLITEDLLQFYKSAYTGSSSQKHSFLNQLHPQHQQYIYWLIQRQMTHLFHLTSIHRGLSISSNHTTHTLIKYPEL